MTARTRPTATVAGQRRRAVRALVLGVALGSTGHIAAVTIAVIVAREISGDASLSGTPAAAVVFGAALGAASLAWFMTKRTRRAGLSLGYAISVVGALVAVVAVVGESLPLLLAASLLIGFGNSSNQLSRYAAADMYPPERRASAIGTVVWASTVGAVIGPNLVDPSGRFAESIGLPALSGPYLVPIVLVALASITSFVFLRPDPYELADKSSVRTAADASAAPLNDIIRRPVVLAAIVALIVAQFVMVLIMTMTPLHMDDHGHDLAAIGLVTSAHTFGMFALAPISGRLTDRFGSVRVIYAGCAVLAISGILAAAAPPDSNLALGFALFLLGFGWNLGYVAGSSMLTGGVSLTERTRVQGLADAVIWSTAAIASLSSGVLVATYGFAALGLVGAVLVIVPLWLIASRRDRIADRVGPAKLEPIGEAPLPPA